MKTILIISDVPLVFYKTKYGMVLCAIGNEESADTDSGEKVRMTTSMLLTCVDQNRLHSYRRWVLTSKRCHQTP